MRQAFAGMQEFVGAVLPLGGVDGGLNVVLTSSLHQPSIEMSISTPMNWVKRITGVSIDHTGQNAILKTGEQNKKYSHYTYLSSSTPLSTYFKV